jgi:CDP-glucose 4,6-dehydratase
LTLDASQARRELGWHDALDFERAVTWTVDWSRRVQAGESARDVTLEQIATHARLARVEP